MIHHYVHGQGQKLKSKKLFTPDNSFLLRYKGLIDTGDIIVGYELYKELENLVDDLVHNDEYYYDTSDALARIDFMQNCVRLTKSPFYNKPMVLMEWQKAFIETIYSFKMSRDLIDDGKVIDRFKKILLLIARKNTKALDLNTRIPTPTGDKTMREINAGDFVFGVNGKPVRVLSTSEIFKNRPCYEFTFEDGEKIVCDVNHKWTVQTKGVRNCLRYTPKTNRKPRLKNRIDENGNITLYAHEMVNDFMRVRADGLGKEYKYRVPVPQQLEYPEKELPVDPYVLGVWLGDGDHHDNRITVSKDDLQTLSNELIKRNVTISSIKEYDGKFEVRIGKNIGHKNDIRECLRAINVWKNKHIPVEYLNASINQRLELLRGLMDTDGTVSKAGQCVFVQKRKTMIDGFSALLSSLGIKHTIKLTDAKCGDVMCKAYRVQFWVDKEHTCFNYARKTVRLKDKLADRMNYKSIIDIKEVETRDTKCITVDSPDGLFLCGNRNTVTHNSETCSGLGLSEFIVGNPGSDIVCSSNDDNQASLVYDAIDTMRLLIDPDGLDTHRNQRYILNRATNTKIFKLSDRTRNKEGRNIDFGIVDEVHEMKNNVIVKSIEQSQSLKDNPKLILITTEGFIDGGYLDEELKKARGIINGEDDSISAKRYLPWLYTQDSEQEVFNDPDTWVKSNPTLGIVKKKSYLEEQVDLAKKSKADRIFVLAKDFNIKQNVAVAWLNLEDYNYDATFDPEELRGSFVLGHVDLAQTNDLVCAEALTIKNGTRYILQQYFIPERKLLPENDDHNAGAKYKEWVDAGLITVAGTEDVDLTVVADWFYSLYNDYGIKLYKCGYDQRFAKEWLTAMDGYGWVKGDDLIRIDQNAETLNNAILLCEAELKAQKINYNNNPVTKWCFGNSCLKLNDKRQALVIKTNDAKKIDGSVTLVSLYEMFRRYRTELKNKWGLM